MIPGLGGLIENVSKSPAFQERLEKIIEEIARKEFRYIERLGGIIGFIIGLVQAVLVFMFF